MDLLVLNPITGKQTGLDRTVRRALSAMRKARIPYCVIGAAALAARGLPRMTRDLDLTVREEDQPRAVAALRKAGLVSRTPAEDDGEIEPMLVFQDPETDAEVDLLAATGDPEFTVIAQAMPAAVFGLRAPVATLEHLLLMYLYSNQPRHWGDFASIVQSGRADLKAAERLLRGMHAEMMGLWRKRVKEAQSPPPAPARPKPRMRRRP